MTQTGITELLSQWRKFNLMQIRLHGLLSGAVLLVGCATFTPVTLTSRDPRNGQGSEISGVRVLRETSHLLSVEVDYRYDGSVGNCAFVGVITQCSGASICRDEPKGSWAFVPAQLLRGHHRARVLISMNDTASNAYVSDQLRIELYEGGKSDFVQATASFEKYWQRSPTLPDWATNWCKVEKGRPLPHNSCH